LNALKRFGSMLMLGIVLLAFISPSISSPARADPLYMTLVQEDFESVLWPSNWSRSDSISTSGNDYWGVSTYRAYTGVRSAWCAQIGTNSVNFVSNSVNHYYDNNMSAIMQIYLGDLSGYYSVSLSFYYRAETEVGSWGDFLEVHTWDGNKWSERWSQSGYSTSGWVWVNLSLPISTEYLSFVFLSDSYSVESSRPEGVYVDDILVGALDDSPPESTLGPIDYYHSTSEIFVPYMARDLGGSGVHHVELYCRYGDSGPFEKFTTEECEDGNWTVDFIPLNASLMEGDGVYQLYMIAVDNMYNTEETPTSYEIEIVIDTAAPSTSSNISGTVGTGEWYVSAVDVELIAEDNTSGVNTTYYSSDSRLSWHEYTGEISVSGNGQHEILYYSEDNAGNREMTHAVSFSVDTDNPVLNVSCNTAEGVIDASYLEIELSCEDNTSGIDHIEVIREGLITRYYSGSMDSLNLSSLSSGMHEIEIRAIDCAGNFASSTISFEVDISEESETKSSAGAIDMPLIAAIAAIAAIIALVMLILTLRPKKGSPEMSSISPEKSPQ